MEQYDLAIIGSGAGLMLVEPALENGLRCALIEKDKIGGTCLTKGCIPSKMLVYPAEFKRDCEQAERIGIHTGKTGFDWDTIAGRMWEQINFSDKIEDNLAKDEGLVVYKGNGAFTSTHTLKVHFSDGRPDEEIRAERIVVAAGARSQVPYEEELRAAGYITSEDFFGQAFPQKPWKSLAIIGSGSISLEFAHIFSSFGTEVTIIARSGRILTKEDEEVSDFAARQHEANGVRILTNSLVASSGRAGDEKRLIVRNRLTGEETKVVCDEVLVASGVRTNTDLLAAQNAGLAMDENGWIMTNEYLETSQPRIWAIGDINGKHQFRHKANYEAEILMHNLFAGGPRRAADYSAVPWAIFSRPQIAHVGITENEARDMGIPYRVAKNQYSDVVAGRAMGYREGAADDGFVKMIVSEDRRILGVHIIGPQAPVLIQPYVYIMQSAVAGTGGTPGSYDIVNNSMVIHPSLGELTAWAFEDVEDLDMLQ